MIPSNTLLPALDRMSERDVYVLCHYFGWRGEEVATYDKIANDLGITRQRAHQIKKRAVSRALDILWGRYCYRCRRSYTVEGRAQGRPVLRCAVCGGPMDKIPGRKPRRRRSQGRVSVASG